MSQSQNVNEVRILHFSDLHLSPDLPQTVVNWEICLEIISEAEPDLTVIGGDVVLDDPDDSACHAFAREQLSRIGGLWHLVPGNHDVGDNLERPYQGQAITDARRSRYRHLYGEDWWKVDLGGWRVLGLNSMLPGSGLDAEREQLNWLKACLKEWSGPVLPFLHKPLCVDHLADDPNPQWALTDEQRQPFVTAFLNADVRAVGSGHLHCHRHLRAELFEMVWAPSTCLVHSVRISGTPKTTGWIEYVLHGEQWTVRHHSTPVLPPIDLTRALAHFVALRTVPRETLRGLKPSDSA